MQIYGSEQDVQLIKHLFETTRETFRRLAREQYKQTNTSDSKNVFVRSFLIGACRGLNSKIVRMTQDYTREQGNQQEYALMVKTALEKAQAYVSTHVNARQVNSRNSSAGSLAGYMSGIETGKNHSMHIPVESSKTNTKSPKKLC